MAKILIVGCGAVGSVLACKLSRLHELTAYDKDCNLVKIIKRNGIKLYGAKQNYKINITDKIDDIKTLDFDLIIFATKCYNVVESTNKITKCCSSSRILYIQNGLIDIDSIQKNLPDTVVYSGILMMATYTTKKGEINASKKGTIYLGSTKASDKDLSLMKDVFSKAGFKSVAVKDPAQVIWAKLIFSSVMNPFPILVNSDYNIIRNNKDCCILIRRAIEEGKKVAKKLGIRLYFDPLNIVDDIRNGKYRKFHHMGSMYYDFINHRITENDYITGKLVQEAKRLNIKVPTLEVIYRLVKILENRRMGNGKR